MIAGCKVMGHDLPAGHSYEFATGIFQAANMIGALGYWGASPADKDQTTGGEGVAVRVAESFAKYLSFPDTIHFDGEPGVSNPWTSTGDDVLDAWLCANMEYGTRAIAYTRDHYWFMDRGLLSSKESVIGPKNWP